MFPTICWMRWWVCLALDVLNVLPREAQINLRLLVDLLPSLFTPDFTDPLQTIGCPTLNATLWISLFQFNQSEHVFLFSWPLFMASSLVGGEFVCALKYNWVTVGFFPLRYEHMSTGSVEGENEGWWNRVYQEQQIKKMGLMSSIQLSLSEPLKSKNCI